MLTLDLHSSAKNLRTDIDAMITRIIFENNRAVGVEYHLGRQVKRVRARKGVILTSGGNKYTTVTKLVWYWKCG